MPRLIKYGENQQLSNALGNAAGAINAMLVRQQEAERLGLAKQGLELRKQAQAANIDQGQQRIDLARDGMEFDQGQSAIRNSQNQQSLDLRTREAERVDAVYADAESEEAATREYFAGLLGETDMAPEQIEVLRNADLSILQGAANQAAHQKVLGEAAQKLETKAEIVLQSLEISPEDPLFEGMKAALQESSGTLEGIAQFDSALTEMMQSGMAQRAEAAQRAEMSANMQPLVENLKMKLTPSASGVVSTAFALFQYGQIDEEEMLDSMLAAVKDSRSSTTNRTLEDEFATSLFRSVGTGLGRGEITKDEAESLKQYGRSGVGASMDSSQQTASRGQGGLKSAASVQPESYKQLVQDYGQGSITEAIELASQKQTPQEREDFLTNRAFMLAIEKYGDKASDEQIASILAPLLTIVEAEYPSEQ